MFRQNRICSPVYKITGRASGFILQNRQGKLHKFSVSRINLRHLCVCDKQKEQEYTIPRFNLTKGLAYDKLIGVYNTSTI